MVVLVGIREHYIQDVKTALVPTRKTTPYFVCKTEVMQKLTTMTWLKDKIGRKRVYKTLTTRGITSAVKPLMRSWRSSKMVKSCRDSPLWTTKEQRCQIMSGACAEQGSALNMMVFVRKRNEATGKVLCGMSYQQYSLEEKNDLGNLSREDAKDAAAGYCVLLLYREKENREVGCL